MPKTTIITLYEKKTRTKENIYENVLLTFNYFNLIRSERKRQQLSTWIFPHRFTVWTKQRSCENLRANEYCTNDPSKARTRLYSFENEREKCEKARKWKERKKNNFNKIRPFRGDWIKIKFRVLKKHLYGIFSDANQFEIIMMIRISSLLFAFLL